MRNGLDIYLQQELQNTMNYYNLESMVAMCIEINQRTKSCVDTKLKKPKKKTEARNHTSDHVSAASGDS